MSDGASKPVTGGLEGVVAAETVLSHVDGEAGRLIIRGHDVDALAGHASFEAAVALLWGDIVPTAGAPSEGALREAFGHARLAAYNRFVALKNPASSLAPIEAMRFMLASLPDDARAAEPTIVVGAAAVAAALAIRWSRGEAAVPPEASAPHAADLLRMIRGRAGTTAEAAALDAYLVTILDHGFNASTFTARVVASTEAGLVSSVVAALGALKGPLHGGAPGPVLDMLDAIGTAEAAPGWIAAELAAGRRLMGFGHRMYRVRDPRADVLKAALSRLGARSPRLALATAVEAAALAALGKAKPGRRLDTNVEFYTALLLDALGIPREGFTPLFAAGRSAGWTAHVREQEATGRLIRPAARYVGPWPAEAA